MGESSAKHESMRDALQAAPQHACEDVGDKFCGKAVPCVQAQEVELRSGQLRVKLQAGEAGGSTKFLCSPWCGRHSLPSGFWDKSSGLLNRQLSHVQAQEMEESSARLRGKLRAAKGREAHMHFATCCSTARLAR